MQLERHFLDIIDNGRKAAEIFDVWQLSPLQLKEGWKTSGNDCIGRKVRRIYDNVTEADGRIMAYLPANPKEGDPEYWYMVHDDPNGDGEDLEKVRIGRGPAKYCSKSTCSAYRPTFIMGFEWHKWIGQKIAMSDENGNIVHANIIKYRQKPAENDGSSMDVEQEEPKPESPRKRSQSISADNNIEWLVKFEVPEGEGEQKVSCKRIWGHLPPGYSRGHNSI